MSASARPRPTPSSKRTANSIASMRLKYAELSGGREPGVIFAAMPETRADRLDRMSEQVAVVELRAPAESAHRVPQLRLHDRVDDDRGPPLHPVDREVEVLLRLDARVADLDELLVRETAPRAAWTRRAAVSPVASDTTCSSTGGARHSADAIGCTRAPVSPHEGRAGRARAAGRACPRSRGSSRARGRRRRRAWAGACRWPSGARGRR